MRDRLGLKLVLILCLSLASAQLLACYSGLLLIPTTDVVPHGQYSMELQTDAVDSAESGDPARFVNMQFGLLGNLELGLDFDVSANQDHTEPIGNFKYVISPDGQMPLAIGLYNAVHSTKSVPYAVTGSSFTFGRLHAGVLRSVGKPRLFGGFDRELGNKWTLYADYTAGRENYRSLGANYVASKDFSVCAGVGRSNDGSGDVLYSLHLVFSGALW